MKKGIYTALVTPFANGKIDFEALDTILQNQIEAKVAGVVVLGTTGENPTLSEEERRMVVAFVLQKCKGKIEVVVGCGSNSTTRTLAEIEQWNQFDLDAILLCLPAYNKPNFLGLAEHVKLVCDACKHPIVVYNIPGRTALKLSERQLQAICSHPKVVGLKEASGDLELFCKTTKFKEDFLVYTGNDPQFLPSLKLGGCGAISVASNLFPKEMNTLFLLHQMGRTKEADAMFLSMQTFLDSLFLETNPVPIKYYLSLYGVCSREVRLPLGNLEQDTKKQIDAIFEKEK